MKVLVLGSTGMIGSRIVDELAGRGHDVTRAIRQSSAGNAIADASVVCDPRDELSVEQAAKDHDVIVSALGGAAKGDAKIVTDVAPILLAAAERAGISKLVIVGGAGSLVTGDGVRLIDGPNFLDAWKAGSQAQIDALEVYKAYDGPLNWTYVSPSDVISPGARTGRLEYGRDELLVDAAGQSYVSAEDFAYAIAVEVESDSHPRCRFTVRSQS